MPANSLPWPSDLDALLFHVGRCDRDGVRRGDVDVTSHQLTLLHEFETRARHRLVCFHLPGEPGPLVAEMNPVFGIGLNGAGLSTVRLSFHSVRPYPADTEAGRERQVA